MSGDAALILSGRAPVVDDKGNFTNEARRNFQSVFNKLQGSINELGQLVGTLQGQIAASSKIVGRSEGIGTTVSQLTSVGKLASTDQIAADGTGTPLAGGIRAAVAIDSNNRLTNSFRQNPVDVSSSPLSSTGLSNDGISTVIPVDAGSYQFGPGSVPYNSGSVDPGVFGGPYIIYFDDPTFAGGAVTFHFTTNPSDTVGALGRISVGSITTVNGAAKTGGGYSGGTGGKGGGRGYSGL